MLAEELERVARLDNLGQEEHSHFWVLRLDLLPGLRALVGLRRGHAHVHDRDCGLRAPHGRGKAAASPTSATTSKPPSVSRRVSPPRMSTESFAITTRTGSLPRRETVAGRALDVESTSQGFDTVHQSTQTGPVVGASAADSVVLDLDDEHAVPVTGRHGRLRGSRMLHDVRQRLAHHEVRGRLDLRRETFL